MTLWDTHKDENKLSTTPPTNPSPPNHEVWLQQYRVHNHYQLRYCVLEKVCYNILQFPFQVEPLPFFRRLELWANRLKTPLYHICNRRWRYNCVLQSKHLLCSTVLIDRILLWFLQSFRFVDETIDTETPFRRTELRRFVYLQEICWQIFLLVNISPDLVVQLMWTNLFT